MIEFILFAFIASIFSVIQAACVYVATRSIYLLRVNVDPAKVASPIKTVIKKRNLVSDIDESQRLQAFIESQG